MKEKPNFRERAQYLISPRWGQQAYAARLKREQETQAVRQSATGYGNHDHRDHNYISHGKPPSVLIP